MTIEKFDKVLIPCVKATDHGVFQSVLIKINEIIDEFNDLKELVCFIKREEKPKLLFDSERIAEAIKRCEIELEETKKEQEKEEPPRKTHFYYFMKSLQEKILNESNKSEENTILNCPFCNGKANVGTKDNGWVVYCNGDAKECDLVIKTRTILKKEDAIENWNNSKYRNRK